MFISFGRVHWKLCRGWMGFAEECVTGEGPEEPFALPGALRSPASPGPSYCLGQQWNLRVWIEDAAGNVDLSPSNAGGIRAAVMPMCIPPGDGNPKPDTPTPTTKTKTKTSLAIGGRLTATGKGSQRRKRLTVTATTKPGNAGGTVRLQVTGKQGKRRLSRSRNVRLANGRASFTLKVPKGFRRLSVKATYAGSETHTPSSRTSTVRIP